MTRLPIKFMIAVTTALALAGCGKAKQDFSDASSFSTMEPGPAPVGMIQGTSGCCHWVDPPSDRFADQKQQGSPKP